MRRRSPATAAALPPDLTSIAEEGLVAAVGKTPYRLTEVFRVAYRCLEDAMNRTLRILLVEDSPDDALLLMRAIRRGGYEPECTRVASAEEMAQALDQQSWDIVISDYVIPGFGGMEALTLFRDRELDIPFILISGHIGEEIAVSALKAGADDYIMKDRMARLVPAIDRAMVEAERRRQHQRANKALKESEERFRQLAGVLDRRVQERTADLRAANIELRSQMQERKRLETELLEIAENERRRIGFDLHDDIGQRLMGLSLLVKALEHKLEEKKVPDAATAHRVADLLDEVINHTEDLADCFSSFDPRGKPLDDLLQNLIARVTQTFDVECSLHVGSQLPALSPEVTLQLYKIAQEAVGSAIKHGKARSISVVLGVCDAKLFLQIKNDGVPHQTSEDVGQQLGLRIMQYRAHTVGGHLTLHPNGNCGTVVTCSLPVAPESGNAAPPGETRHTAEPGKQTALAGVTAA